MLLLYHLVLLSSVSLGSASIQIYFQGIQSELPEAKVQEALPAILAHLTNAANESSISITSYKSGNLTWSSDSLDTCDKVIKFIDETQNSRTLKISFREDIKAPDEITSNCPTKRDKIPGSPAGSKEVNTNSIETTGTTLAETISDELSDNEVETPDEPNASSSGCSDPEDEYCANMEKESKQLSRENVELKDTIKLAQDRLEAKDKELQQAIANTSEANRINQQLETKISIQEKELKEIQEKLDEASQAADDNQKAKIALADELKRSEEMKSELESRLNELQENASKLDKDYVELVAKLSKFEEAEKQLIAKRQLVEQKSSGANLNNEQPSYGKYIGLGIGFLIVVAYLICARSYSKHGMYELHSS